MSAMLGQLKIRVDENASEKINNMKKIGVEVNKADKIVRRAALGDIQNRQARAIATGKEAALKDLKDVKLSNAKGNAKARVNTYWKKGELPTAAAVAGNQQTNILPAKPLRTSVVGLGAKVLTRSNSLRLATAKVSSTNSINAQPQIKTVTTKLVENKVQKVKIEKILPAETKLRREDSNISRKSLTKLKAVLSKGTTASATTTATAKTSAVVATAKSTTNAVAAPKPKTKSPDKVEKVTNVVVQSKNINLRIVDVKSHSTALIEGVRDIDEGDHESLILVSEYVNDIYEYLFQLEVEQPIRKQHLSNQTVVTPKMRAVLLDWIHEVHSQFHLMPETFHITVGIIDRYLQVVPNTLRTNLQLVGVTALFIASKYEELYPPAISDFIYMTDHSYTQQQLLEMEIHIFRTLDCNLSRPVCIHFLRRFSKAADVDDELHAMSKYLLELAAIEYELAHYRPSEIAAASLFLSLHLFKCNSQNATGFKDALWDATLEYYSHYNANHLRPITRKIAATARYASESKLNAVYTKYAAPKFYKVAIRSSLYSALMDSIIKTED